MTLEEFLEKLKKNIDVNIESFTENMKKEGISKMDYCGWFFWFFAWIHCETEYECDDCYDEFGDML